MAERARGVNRRDAGSGHHREMVRNDPGGRRSGPRDQLLQRREDADLLKGRNVGFHADQLSCQPVPLSGICGGTVFFESIISLIGRSGLGPGMLQW
ncbi:hypothetical protein [Rhodovulum sulfidophilum]|uniref:hypothetical protein n=1 Tax=Rhodovulum sulfidophilum TaxID=35806 RepID=UPI001F40ED93|nr:hypothetical protein [Rhodovulum sulfidophilum]MCE8441950.1 hypothetical protein [Rhodovulum sulfidophilum]